MRKWLIVVGVAAGVWWRWGPAAERRYTPGVLVPESPQQTELPSGRSWSRPGYTFTALAEFRLRARVLGAARYRFDREAELSPVDLALGWGKMSDQTVLDQLKISQSGRWYEWRTKEAYPIPHPEIVEHSGNMHLIPATATVDATLKRVRRGEVVTLRGYLVEIVAADGWRWRSSLSREDSGARSCEVVWVEELSVR